MGYPLRHLTRHTGLKSGKHSNAITPAVLIGTNRPNQRRCQPVSARRIWDATGCPQRYKRNNPHGASSSHPSLSLGARHRGSWYLSFSHWSVASSTVDSVTAFILNQTSHVCRKINHLGSVAMVSLECSSISHIN